MSKLRGDLGGRDARRDRRVQRAARRRDGRAARARARVATTARSSSSGQTVPPAVLCVFSSATHRRARRVEAAVGVHRRADLLGRQPAAVPGQPARLQAGVQRGAAELGDHDVRASPRRPARCRARRGSRARSGCPSSPSAGRRPPPGRAAPRRAARARAPSGPRAPARRRPRRSPSPRAFPATACVCVSERRSITSPESNGPLTSATDTSRVRIIALSSIAALAFAAQPRPGRRRSCRRSPEADQGEAGALAYAPTRSPFGYRYLNYSWSSTKRHR